MPVQSSNESSITIERIDFEPEKILTHYKLKCEYVESNYNTGTTLIMFSQSNEKFIVVYNEFRERILKILVSNSTLCAKLIDDLIFVKSKIFMIFNITTKRFEGSMSYNKWINRETFAFSKRYKENSLEDYSNCIYYNKYFIFNEKQSWIVFRSRRILSKEICKFNGLSFKDCKTKEIYYMNDSNFYMMSNNLKINHVMNINENIEILHAEIIKSSIILLIGKKKVYLYKIYNDLDPIVLTLETEIDLNLIKIIKYGTFLILYQNKVILFIDRPDLFNFARPESISFKSFKFICTADNKTLIFLSEYFIILFDSIKNYQKIIKFDTPPINIRGYKLMSSRHLILFYQSSIEKMNQNDKKKLECYVLHKRHRLGVIDIFQSTFSSIDIDSYNMKLLDDKYINVRRYEKDYLITLSDFISWEEQSSKVVLKVIENLCIDKVLFERNNLRMIFESYQFCGYPLLSPRLLLISKNRKRLFITGKNFKLLIISLKYSCVELILTKKKLDIRYILEIFEFEENKSLLLKNNKRIIKFNLKDYSHSILINKKYYNFSILGSNHFSVDIAKPYFKFCVFDVANVKEVQYLKFFHFLSTRFFKLRNKLMISHIVFTSYFNVLQQYSESLFDINDLKSYSWSFKSKFLNNSFYSDEPEYHLVLSKDKKHMFYGHQTHWTLFNLDSLCSKFSGQNWVSYLVELSDDSKYLCLGSDEGIISYYDLNSMKHFEFANHMKILKYISIFDGLVLSYADKDDSIVANDLIFN